MKLYSRSQMIVVSAVSVAVTAGILTLIGLSGILGSGGNSDSTSGTSGPSSSIPFDSPPRATDPIDIQPDPRYSEDEQVNIRIYEELNSAVVNINTETLGLTWFLEPVPREGGTGSGSIIDERGYVLTNYHVVKDAYKVFLTFADGTQVEGEVTGKDAENDLAIIKFDPKGMDLTVITFGTSEGLKVGQKVLAIGNPFAFERTLTTGIVSGLGRPIRTGSYTIREMIQTDASINPGNSGGPLINARGQMIGVNTMIYSPSGGSVGIGFAVPVDTALRVLPDLLEFGVVRRGWIDISPVQLDPSLVRYAQLGVSSGILVSEVVPGSNAAKAGIRGGDSSSATRYGRSIIYLNGDIITAIDGEPIGSFSDFFGALEKSRPGDEVTVTVVRGRRTLDIPVVLSERSGNISLE